MATSSGDLQLAAAAAGFTLGFGTLTVWRAVKQTKQNKSPHRSVFIYMIWGEILANLLIGILGWLFLNDVLKAEPVVLFFILFCYVFEVQLLLQIIINRIAIIVERRTMASKLKWTTAVVISVINIMVMCIWIPAHMTEPPSQTYVQINKYWDRVSKILICLVDAGLNWYFIHTVNARLIKQHGLRKYKPLIGYYTRLGILSICMDVMLLGLMALPNQVVYIQFHPVAYMVKLHVEMSMADLIVKVATTSEIDVRQHSSSGTPFPESRSHVQRTFNDRDTVNGAKNTAHIGHTQGGNADREDMKGIQRQTEVQIFVGDSDSENHHDDLDKISSRTSAENSYNSHGVPQYNSNNPFSKTHGQHRLSDESQIPLKDLTRTGDTV
ncbi:hypothetical protein AUEXF2481DRAFT_3335 [Aureobasidium subglaciale EXF-2481]|uniref:Uncharacterized protein n=1 Tax=Aureobasidium subglaciale (strain EXF-2481) TaxID=1043005 RepID=A0A074YIJ9_AURSE|nr:uncharacterized protein AUEXF2481DRAFT_3335 [Aureobasidium subglaciale EXF-2481]KAI5198976.1 hypothetical protein E4T38_07262 [Aureobasidium subglaciale]KAI5217824.1 hypothetical protein E4T40_07273 [Aureobasidium subglaciale]KAI5220704.1 hypothetical protein E4T41_07427 [Aureobasidium subglaciale]KAI5258390.1 hypothetical protein E4T46_07404 [Aureobasidium subglaciale]KEQ97530.1 hypothetical protein AUEXF2481DRAFT_3335 [Aureobasidium subglaciale EXF-2481]